MDLKRIFHALLNTGFDAVCLNIWVLQAAYFAYRQRYGTPDVQDQPLECGVFGGLITPVHSFKLS